MRAREPSTWKQELPAELRARAERFRRLALDFSPDVRTVVLEVAEELEETAARLETPSDQPSD